MEKTSFSISPSTLDQLELKQAMDMNEEYFGTSNDPEQAPVTMENAKWIRNAIPSCLQIIRSGKKIIGVTLIYPCTKDLMNKFISKKITEADLFDKIHEPENRKPEAFYLCSALILPEFRGQGLAFKSLLKSIKDSMKPESKPSLFYWAFSLEGDKLAMKIANALNLPILKRD